MDRNDFRATRRDDDRFERSYDYDRTRRADDRDLNPFNDRDRGYARDYDGDSGRYDRDRSGRSERRDMSDRHLSDRDYNRDPRDRGYDGYGRGPGARSGRGYDADRDYSRYSDDSGRSYGYARSFDRADRDDDRDYRAYGDANRYGENDRFDYGERRRYDASRDAGGRDYYNDRNAARFGRDNYDRPDNYDRDADGPHRGRGPEGYTRNSERIVEDVSERLTDDGHLDAASVRVTADDGEVTLEGTVASRRDKRRAEDLAEDVRGVRDVHNRLTVRKDDGSDGTDARTSALAGSATTERKAKKASA